MLKGRTKTLSEGDETEKKKKKKKKEVEETNF
jgi:hypothetical protein